VSGYDAIEFKVPQDEKAALVELAGELGTTISELLRQDVRRLLSERRITLLPQQRPEAAA
jgi:Ribbon-helix-helix protein, copG family